MTSQLAHLWRLLGLSQLKRLVSSLVLIEIVIMPLGILKGCSWISLNTLKRGSSLTGSTTEIELRFFINSLKNFYHFFVLMTRLVSLGFTEWRMRFSKFLYLSVLLDWVPDPEMLLSMSEEVTCCNVSSLWLKSVHEVISTTCSLGKGFVPQK